MIASVRRKSEERGVKLAFALCPVVLTLFAPASFAQAVSKTVAKEPKAAKVSLYLPGPPLDFRALVPPPPSPGSTGALADATAVHQAEKHRSPEQVKEVQRDDREESMFAFADVLGPGFRASDLPLTAALSQHLRAESSVINPGLKIAFDRPRPFVNDATVHPVCEMPRTNSYPSGHAMVGYLEAFALAQMLPERSEAILHRAAGYAHNRVVCGVHYPTDVEASRTIALALYGALSTSERFQQELDAARVELRRNLSLP